MRLSRLAALCAAAVLLTSPAAAQNSECAGVSTFNNGRQTCDAAVDFARAYHPLAGLAASGGNPVLGSGGTTGRFGSFSVTLRANMFTLSVPDLSNVGADGTVPQQEELLAPAPLIEANLGIFPGTSSGLFSVDLLAAAQLVPNEEFSSDIRVDPGAARIGPVSLGLGFGARLGLLPSGGSLPAVAVSVMRRSIPSVGYGDVAAGDQIAADVSLNATNIRLTAGKQFSVLTLAAGLGWSRYSGEASADYDAGVGAAGQGTVALELSQSRMLYFVDAGLDFRFVKLVGEIGYQEGKDQGLGTTFTGFDDTKGTTFYSVGLRVGI